MEKTAHVGGKGKGRGGSKNGGSEYSHTPHENDSF